MGRMRRREPPRPAWPEPDEGARAPGPCYAAETFLLPGATPGDDDAQVRSVILAVPDGAGQLRRVGICNSAGIMYREVALHGPVQLLYLCAGLNALGFRQRLPEAHGISKYWMQFARDPERKTAARSGR
ncbi:hypothetical protein GCM10028813_02450 [Ramlibacter alkalitolerans]